MVWVNNKIILKLGTILFIAGLVQVFSFNLIPKALAEKNPQANSQTIVPNAADSRKYQEIIVYADRHNLDRASIGTIVQTVATQLLGSRYQAGLLDRSTQETLVVSLQQFDCLLFVETVLAIADNIGREEYSYQSLADKVENQRYWNGKMNGYCSRLHYFSDWIEDNQKRGNVKNITSELGGINTVKKLDFMTAHRSSYPSLSKSDLNFKCIASVEDSLSEKFNYIPTKSIKEIYSQLKPGDIIGVATNIPGLDFTHTGFVYQHNGNFGLIHASPAGKVAIAKDLQNYVTNVKNAIGIVVTRASEPKLR